LGEVLREKVGNNGFGYDPIFYLPTQGCTSAELAPEVKNTISHSNCTPKSGTALTISNAPHFS
jgi:inosine/xanthosine triphosphate pyrophosphatase family protein